MAEDKDLLLNFMESVHGDMGSIVDRIDLIAPERKDIHHLVKDSWKEVTLAFGDAENKLREITPENLMRVGLSGVQLKLKLQEFNRREDQFREKWGKFSELLHQLPTGWDKMRQVTSGLKKAISRHFKATDIIIESLSQVIPPLHIITELKDAIESSMSK